MRHQIGIVGQYWRPDGMAKHYDTQSCRLTVPAVGKAKSLPSQKRAKAGVEAALLIIECWLLGRLRHRRFYSLPELNATIIDLLRQLTDARLIHRQALSMGVGQPVIRLEPAPPAVRWKSISSFLLSSGHLSMHRCSSSRTNSRAIRVSTSLQSARPSLWWWRS